MKNPLQLFASVLLLSVTSARADLPTLTGPEVSGYFLASKDDQTFFGVTARAEGQVHPLDRKGKILRPGNPITVDFRVIETRPTGELVRKPLDFSSLESEQPATEEPKKPMTFRGKVKGDATFEVTVTPERDGFSASGRVTGNGKLTKNPVHFGIDLLLEPFKNVKMETEEEKERFETMSKRDELKVVTAEGKREKFDIDEVVNLAERFPEGVVEISLECARYEGTEFEITASEGSRIMFKKRKAGPVFDALKLFWTAAPGKDTAKEKLTFVAK